MLIDEFKEKFPKSWEKLKVFQKNNLIEFQKKISAGQNESVVFPEIKDDVVEKSLEGMMMFSIRSLYEFFDGNNIEIEIFRGWKYNVNNTETNEEYNSRIECESAAFQAAFKLLESI